MADDDYLTAEHRQLAENAAARWGVSPRIHRGDGMFHFVFANSGFANDPSRAIEYYFDDGAKSAKRLHDLLRDVEGDRPLRLLEFASGYGCVTRHLAQLAPGLATTACDVHPEAITFIRNVLGVPAVVSDSNPDALRVDERFDVVFALSFFSHVPKSTFTRWLRRLAARVVPGGLLVFTTHGLATLDRFRNEYLASFDRFDAEGFYFRTGSEQADLDAESYGTTVAMPEFVERALFAEPTWRLVRFAEGTWWSHQDLWVVRICATAPPRAASS